MIKKIVIGALLMLAAFGAGYMSKPAEVKTEIKEVTKWKVKEKIVRDVIEVETKKPDGTVVTRREIKDRSTTKKSGKEKSQSKEQTINIRPQWSVGLYTVPYGEQRVITTIDRRIIGNLSVGVYGRLTRDFDNEVGVGLRFEF